MILLSPWCRPLRNGKPHPKNYPWWPELVALLPWPVAQLGVKGEKELVTDCRFGLPLAQVRELVRDCTVWIAVDNFLQHMAHQEGKRGVVLWGQGDPQIFGYPENVNVLKGRKYLRAKPFDIWEVEKCIDEAFLRPADVVAKIRKHWPVLWADPAAVTAQ